MLVRPSLVLQVELLPEEYSEDAAAEVKRSYMHMAQSLVKEAPEADCDDANLMRLCIRLMRPYWNENDPDEQSLWEGSMRRWLQNITRNISTDMHNFNTVMHPPGTGNIVYNWADFEFDDNAVFRVKVDADNRIDSAIPQVIEKARSLLSAGAFGDGEIARIRIPSLASYQSQLQAAQEAQEAQQDAPAEDGTETEHAEEQEVSEEASEPATDSAEEDGEVEEIEESDATPRFDIDFSVWGIEYADGSIHEFDSESD